MKQNTVGAFLCPFAVCLICLFSFPASAADEPLPFSDITPEQALVMMAAGQVGPGLTLIDVRKPEEFQSGFIKSAVLIELTAADFQERIGKLDRKGRYLLYCRSGARSARAMKIMKEFGFETVFNLAGGIRRWQAENHPLEK